MAITPNHAVSFDPEPSGVDTRAAVQIDAGDVVVDVQGVGKRYDIYRRPVDRLKQMLWRGRRQFYHEFWALRDVSLAVRRGEAVGIIGRNGSGKSTLLQIVAGTLRPTEGRLDVRGRVHALLELGSGFNSEFTGRENVFLNGAILGLKEYSTGMVVRLAFAIQVQLSPDILVVDEALAVGDEKFQRKCFARLEELQRLGVSVLLVTHSSDIVLRYCQRALLLEGGRVHGTGPSKEIVDQYHALLYADEEAYLRWMNREAEVPPERPSPALAPDPAPIGDSAPTASHATTDGDGARALIDRVWITDGTGTTRELFLTGEQAEIGFAVRVLQPLVAIQAGIRIRTVEGVEVYGTSTRYLGKSLADVPAGALCTATFRMRLELGAGTYFVSVAVAEPRPGLDMLYLDKRSDVRVLRIREHPVTGTGIAHLHADVSFTARTVQHAG